MTPRETVYYDEGGPDHTISTLKAAHDAAKELGITKLVVASTTGETGVKAAEMFKNSGVRVIAVGHQTGFPKQGVQRFTDQNRMRIEALGGAVTLGTDVLTNSIRRRQRLGVSPLSIVTQTLAAVKLKVNAEVVLKACDAELIEPGEHVLAVAGSHTGADTAVSMLAADSANILDLRLQYIVAMPLSREKADREYMAARRAVA